MKPHKWAKEIKAWADGAEIEQYHDENTDGEWVDFNGYWGDFNCGWEFRIKPQPKEPQYLYVYKINGLVRLVEAGGFVEIHHKNDHVNYIGKIKLEDEASSSGED